MTDDPLEKLRHLFNEGREVTLEMSERLGVSRRHLRRLIKTLREEGLEINERWEGGVKHFTLDPSSRKVETPVDLEESELYALTVSAYAAQAMLRSTPLQEELRAAVETLLEATGPLYSFEPEWQQNIWHFDESETTPIESEIFLRVVRAANRCETLEIDYYSASSREMSRDRRVDPLVIAEQAGSWLLAAYCHEQQDILDFSLGGIGEAKSTGEGFRRPPDFDPEAHFEGRFHALEGEGGHEVAIEVETEKAPYFRRKTYHPSQSIRETRDDGSIVVEYEVSSLDDIAAFIRSWGPGIRVLKPESLVRRIAKEAASVHQAYASNQDEHQNDE